MKNLKNASSQILTDATSGETLELFLKVASGDTCDSLRPFKRYDRGPKGTEDILEIDKM